jgi:hypothetical protein
LESAVLNELRRVSGKHTLKLKEIMAWSTGEIERLADETHFFLPELKVNCAVKTVSLGKRWKPKA